LLTAHSKAAIQLHSNRANYQKGFHLMLYQGLSLSWRT
jgi:hypothetical protein